MGRFNRGISSGYQKNGKVDRWRLESLRHYPYPQSSPFRVSTLLVNRYFALTPNYIPDCLDRAR